MGESQWMYAGFAFHFWRPEGRTSRNEAFIGSSGEASEDHQAPVVDCLRCKHVSGRFQEEPLVQKTDICSSRRQEEEYPLTDPKAQRERMIMFRQ